MAKSAPIFFPGPEAFRAWLAAHAVAGLAAFQQRIERRPRTYSYEREAPPALGVGELAAFQAVTAAWQFFGELPDGYRRTLTHWIVSVRRPDTRVRRLARFMASCARGERLLP